MSRRSIDHGARFSANVRDLSITVTVSLYESRLFISFEACNYTLVTIAMCDSIGGYVAQPSSFIARPVRNNRLFLSLPDHTGYISNNFYLDAIFKTKILGDVAPDHMKLLKYTCKYNENTVVLSYGGTPFLVVDFSGEFSDVVNMSLASDIPVINASGEGLYDW